MHRLRYVVADLLIGNHGRRPAMSQTTHEHFDTFRELVDKALNALVLAFTRQLRSDK